MKHTLLSLLLLMATFYSGLAQHQYRERERGGAAIAGTVIDAQTGEPLSFATVVVKGTTLVTVADKNGAFLLHHLPEGRFMVAASMVGYSPTAHPVEVVKGKRVVVDLELAPDVVALDQIVVSASRTAVTRRKSPGLVQVMTSELIEQAQAVSLADALPFQPGVRVENNCQNCGFSQVRINGLDGNYSQILMDSRPVFSALAGVYGLEHIPANMIDRIEVLRGGGSALYGSSAIGGTINVITRDPVFNSAEVAHAITSIGLGKAWENNTTFNASLVGEEGKTGFLAYGQKRSRQGYDYNGDGFTEIPVIKSNTMGMRAFFKTSLHSKLALQYHHTGEFRRGGDALDLPPHNALLAEQVEHSIHGGGITFDVFSPDYKRTFSVFTSMQHVNRSSYYGAGKDPNAYGYTTDMTVVTGAQYTRKWDRLWFMPAEWVSGMEYNYNGLTDSYPLYQIQTEQIIHNVSLFLQNEWRNDVWGFLLGIRADKHNLVEKPIFSPRVTLRYNPVKNVNFRGSFATGFRAPQAFDEDFHVAVVGGERVVTVLDPGLSQERSRSLSFSADTYYSIGSMQANLVVEAFYTQLLDVFALRMLEETDANGNNVLERYNGSGACVAGINVEGKLHIPAGFQIQAGLTFQRSQYTEPEYWSEDPLVAPVERLFRSPDLYGYMTSYWTPGEKLTFIVSGKYTGSMLIQHFAGSGTPVDVAKETPSFFDMDIKLSYDVTLFSKQSLQIQAGVKNVFNAYQADFDRGQERDSGYIYGPILPRNFFLGIKLGF